VCGPEFSDLEATIWQRYQDQDVVVLGINAGPDPRPVLEVFVDAFQITFPVLLDHDNLVFDQYRLPGPQSPFPVDYVIDRDGTVAYRASEYDPDALTTVIDDLLATTTAVNDLPRGGRRFGLTATPNPFNPRSTVSFTLPEAAVVSLDVVDARGQRVAQLLRRVRVGAGRHRVRFPGTDAAGRSLPTGVYLVRLRVGAAQEVRKLTIVR
jgi:hypothetical protein